MSKLDDSSGALSAAAVAKETLKDRVTQLDLMARSTIWADKCRLWQKGRRIRNRWSPDAR